jgi:aminoglycoside phosphotransferase (APT) family kinase protein
MEAGWERSAAAPNVSTTAVRDALRPWLAGRRIRSAAAIAEGLVNLHLRLEVEGSAPPVVLRVRLGPQDAGAVEVAVLRRVATRVPAPEVLFAGTIATDAGPRPFLLLSHCAGRTLAGALADPSPTHRHARAGRTVGEALARLHAIEMPRLGFLDASLEVPEPMAGLRSAWRRYLDEQLEGLAGRRLGSRREPLMRLVDRDLDRLAPLEGRAVLLHGDAKPTNVRVDRTGRLTGLLDWEFAWAGPPLFDLGQMLRWPVPERFDVAFVEGYESLAGPLDPGWRGRARLLDLANLVGFLGRSAHQPVRERDVLRLIDGYL